MKKKILVAMSGGVDSGVAALLLKKRGYSVVGVTLKLVAPKSCSIKKPCCGITDIEDARHICHTLGIKHYVWNCEEIFRRRVVEKVVNAYLSGFTPNPCILCNQFIKFDYLLRRALALEFDFLATGHYARIRKRGKQFSLYRAVAEKYDQSYFLYRLLVQDLSRIKFPLGEYSKEEIRQIARRNNLGVSNKPASQDICFVIRDYREMFPGSKLTSHPPLIKDMAGNVLGRHRGIENYTVGQREGLGNLYQPRGKIRPRYYVTRIVPEENLIIVGSREDCFQKKIFLKSCIWLANLPENFFAFGKIRSQQQLIGGQVYRRKNGKAAVEFVSGVWAPAPGQSAVFYRNNQVLGGGIIA